jgi:peroxiredoxin Q/BCP
MNAYRDQYASLFRGGRDIVLIGISPETPEELRSWAKDADFPFLFASDPEGTTYTAFGGTPRENGMPGGRSLVVVGPDGRIGEVVPRFREVDPTAYEELQAIIDGIAPPPDEEAM